MANSNHTLPLWRYVDEIEGTTLPKIVISLVRSSYTHKKLKIKKFKKNHLAFEKKDETLSPRDNHSRALLNNSIP